jgi:site-specific DNA-methyltransferase (adenine-specific)
MKNKLINQDCIEVLNKIKKESVDLIIADPPYWKVINESWDYQWKTEQEYIDWSLKWIKGAVQSLRKGGSFYMFGYFRTLALLVPYFPNLGLELRQQIIIDKGMRSVSGRATKNYKIFPNTTESCLLIIKDNKQWIKPFLIRRQTELGLSSKEINELMGVKSNGGGMWSIYTGKNICEQMPTKKSWDKLQKILKFELPYERLAQTFNPQMGYTDVWTDIDFYKEERYHPTQKPIKLIKRLIKASSNEGDFIIDPFMGAGSSGIACKQLKRNFLGIELDSEYFEIAKSRINKTSNKNISPLLKSTESQPETFGTTAKRSTDKC